MLARLARVLPVGDEWIYEPKWDGFRCLGFRTDDDLDLRSRNQRPLARYFPEIEHAMLALSHRRFVVDGELVVNRDGEFDFAALMSRLHPAASRVATLAEAIPATFVAFDLLALDGSVLVDEPFDERRRKLVDAFTDAPPGLVVSPLTSDASVARAWLENLPGRGYDGVVAKNR